MNNRFQVTGCRLQVTGFRFQGKQIGIPPVTWNLQPDTVSLVHDCILNVSSSINLPNRSRSERYHSISCLASLESEEPPPFSPPVAVITMELPTISFNRFTISQAFLYD